MRKSPNARARSSKFAAKIEKIRASIDADWPEPCAPIAQLPTDSAERKRIPVVTGVMDYFPDAIAAVANVSFVGNEKHNPGQPLHWSRGKSPDHADCIGRHLLERGMMDPVTKVRHSAQLAWRALAMLQIEIEADRAAGAHVDDLV
jgi:hypothetical protein